MNNVLVEIKSCTYKDFQWVIKHRKPRLEDFYQCMTYKYILENHLEEIKNPGVSLRTPAPQLSEYNIDTIQFIYVAHDIMGADVESLSEAMNIVTTIKKNLNSKSDQFYFMTSVTLDTNCFDQQPYIDYIKGKIDAINWYVNNNKIPAANDPYVNKNKCFFCLYSNNCEIKNEI